MIEEQRLYRRADAERLTGLRKTSMHALMNSGEFPRPVKIGKRLIAWRGADLAEWIRTREVVQ